MRGDNKTTGFGTTNKSFDENQILRTLNISKNDLLNAKDYFLSNRNDYGIAFCNKQLELNEAIARMLQQSIRFDFLTVQKDMDALFKKDNSLAGVMTYYFWKKPDFEKVGKLIYLINGD